jgi:hypothetical protein
VIGEPGPGRYQQRRRIFESAHGVSLPREGDSRCSPAFKVAAAWREMDGCLAGELDGWLSPFRALGSSPSSDIVHDEAAVLGRFGGKVLSSADSRMMFPATARISKEHRVDIMAGHG